MEKMREEFEKWLCNEYEWGEGALASSEFHGEAVTGYYISGDHIYYGQSCADCLFWAWRGWQASRAAIEITLPQKVVIEAAGKDIPDYADWPDGYNTGIDACAKALVDIGLNVRCADETNIPAQG